MRVLVLGGIRSGKSELAEALVADAKRVRYLATAAENHDDADWSARLDTHRARRPEHWVTEELGAEPQRLAQLLAAAADDDVLLVDDLGGWLNATFQAADDWAQPSVADEAIDAIAEAVRDCPAERLVLVAPEVGLAVLPTSQAGRTFADANGTLNQRVASACDSVAFVVAGQPTWLRGGADFPVRPEAPFTADGARAWSAPPITQNVDATPIQPGLDLPMPDDVASAEATERLLTLDFAGAGLGAFVPVVRFAAATQARADPRPWRSPRVFLLRGTHDGGFSAGDSPAEAERSVNDAHEGAGPLALLAAAAGASVETVDCPPASAAEDRDALDEAALDAALTLGWSLAEAAVDEGADLLVLASCGSGGEAAAAAIVAVATGGEPAALLGRVVSANGFVDDTAWMRRCTAVRDARHRIRARGRDPRSLLAMLGGGDIAVATGVLLGATSRRTPVLFDGPVAVAAGLVARDFGAQTRHWLIMPDHGDHPTVKVAADVLGVEPLLSLRLGLGEGTTALAALPLINSALTLAAATPARPAPEVAPEEPTDEQPAKSAAGESEQPTDAQPTEPTEAQPAEPTGAQPTEPTDAQPAEAVYEQPTMPLDDGLTKQERIDAEVLRMIVDSPTTELPIVPPRPSSDA